MVVWKIKAEKIKPLKTKCRIIIFLFLSLSCSVRFLDYESEERQVTPSYIQSKYVEKKFRHRMWVISRDLVTRATTPSWIVSEWTTRIKINFTRTCCVFRAKQHDFYRVHLVNQFSVEIFTTLKRTFLRNSLLHHYIATTKRRNSCSLLALHTGFIWSVCISIKNMMAIVSTLLVTVSKI